MSLHIWHLTWVFGLFALAGALRAQSINPPLLNGISGGGSVEYGQRVVLEVLYAGNGVGQTYQWKKNDIAISGATAASFLLPTATAADAGLYTITVTNSAGSSTASASITVIPLQAPMILRAPRDLIIFAGQSATFSFAIIGSYPRTYRWFKNGNLISGASDATYSIPSVSLGDAGSYTVTVTNSQGSVTGSLVSLLVNEPTPPAFVPSYSLSVSLVQGQPLKIDSYIATGPGPFTYQWYKNGTAIAGATDAYFSISAVALSDAGNFTVKAANSVGSATSSEAVVSVASATPIAISRHPQSLAVTQGQPAQFSISATYSTPAIFQWKKDGVPISGATSNSSYSIDSAALADAGSYTVTVSNVLGSVTSNVAVLTVTPVVAPAITSQPATLTEYYHSSFTVFDVEVSGSPPFNYTWKKDDIVVNTTNATVSKFNRFRIANATPANSGSYRVTVTNAAGSVTSNFATLTVLPAVAPTISSQPTSAVIYPGTISYPLNVGYHTVGTGPLTFQWRKDGIDIPGAIYSSFALSGSAKESESGDYSVAITGIAGSVTSSIARVLVKTIAPIITTQPSDQTTGIDGAASFHATATGPGLLSYQWRKDGVIISGAIYSSFFVSPAGPADAGVYTVTVTNPTGSTTSNGASLTVTSAPIAPTIATQPTSQAIRAGASVTFTSQASGTAPFTYQWQKNGVDIPRATNASLQLLSVLPVDAGDYRVVVTNSKGSATSNAAVLTVSPVDTAPFITTQPSAQLVTTGSTAVFSVAATGTAPFTFQWLHNGAAIVGATAATITIASSRSSDAGIYSVMVANGAGAVTSASATLTVVSFPGTYFGRFNNNPGDRFALVIRGDGTALFLGYAASLFTGYTATNIVIKPDGTFTADLTEIKPPAANTPAGDALPGVIDPPSLAAAPLTLSGSVASGQLTGGVTGAALSLAAPKSPATGTAQSLAGVYQTSALNSSTGGLTTIVDATGAAFVFSHTTAGVAAGTGTLNTSTGQVIAMLADNSQATTTLNPGSGSATASVTTTSKETLTFAGLAEGSLRTDRLVNIASRGAVSASDLMIAGFVISGSSPKSVMIRATGPALAAFGLGGTLPNPKLELYRGTAKIQENDNWSSASNATEVVATAARTGAFPLAAGTADAVLLTTLDPGAYTAQVSSVTGANGVALVEVYDAGSTAVTADTPRLINISTRANVAGGEGLLIAGIVITGNSPKKILIRATGPALAAFGVPGALTDPLLKLYKGDAVLRQNDNWSDSAAEAALIAAAGSATGAFALTPGTKDASLLITLEPGAYTAQVSGVAGAAGAALVEVYELP